jgi:hypothetical protein
MSRNVWQVAVWSVAVAAVTAVSCPTQANEASVSPSQNLSKVGPRFVQTGETLSPEEVAQYQKLAEQSAPAISTEAGGDIKTGAQVLLVVGGILAVIVIAVVIGTAIN